MGASLEGIYYTVPFLWWINADQMRLQSALTARIESAEPVRVSAISCFEVAWLAHHGRIDLAERLEGGPTGPFLPAIFDHAFGKGVTISCSIR